MSENPRKYVSFQPEMGDDISPRRNVSKQAIKNPFAKYSGGGGTKNPEQRQELSLVQQMHHTPSVVFEMDDEQVAVKMFGVNHANSPAIRRHRPNTTEGFDATDLYLAESERNRKRPSLGGKTLFAWSDAVGLRTEDLLKAKKDALAAAAFAKSGGDGEKKATTMSEYEQFLKEEREGEKTAQHGKWTPKPKKKIRVPLNQVFRQQERYVSCVDKDKKARQEKLNKQELKDRVQDPRSDWSRPWQDDDANVYGEGGTRRRRSRSAAANSIVPISAYRDIQLDPSSNWSERKDHLNEQGIAESSFVSPRSLLQYRREKILKQQQQQQQRKDDDGAKSDQEGGGELCHAVERSRPSSALGRVGGGEETSRSNGSPATPHSRSAPRGIATAHAAGVGRGDLGPPSPAKRGPVTLKKQKKLNDVLMEKRGGPADARPETGAPFRVARPTSASAQLKYNEEHHPSVFGSTKHWKDSKSHHAKNMRADEKMEILAEQSSRAQIFKTLSGVISADFIAQMSGGGDSKKPKSKEYGEVVVPQDCLRFDSRKCGGLDMTLNVGRSSSDKNNGVGFSEGTRGHSSYGAVLSRAQHVSHVNQRSRKDEQRARVCRKMFRGPVPGTDPLSFL